MTLSKNTTTMLKGLFATAVLVHHLYQHSKLFFGTPLGSVLQLLGFLSVSIFFFLSGYGLTVSYLNKKDDYISSFPKNKIFPFYIQIVILIIIYLLQNIFLNIPIDSQSLLQSFLFGKTIINNGWYLQSIFFLYLIFYFVFSRLKKTEHHVFGLIFGFLIYFFTCFVMDLSNYWYETVPVFGIGMIFAALSCQNSASCKKSSFLHIVFSLFAFLVFLLFGYASIFGDTLRMIFRMFSNICFSVFLVSAASVFPYRIRFFEKIGKISFEIYVSQGLFLSLFHSSLIYIKNPYLYILLVTISTFVFSIPLHFMFLFINKKIKK